MQEKMATIQQLSKFSLQVLNIRMITVEELNKFQYYSQITISKGPQNQFIDDRRIFQLSMVEIECKIIIILSTCFFKSTPIIKYHLYIKVHNVLSLSLHFICQLNQVTCHWKSVVIYMFIVVEQCNWYETPLSEV